MDLLVMVPYPEQELSRLQAAAGSLQVEAIESRCAGGTAAQSIGANKGGDW